MFDYIALKILTFSLTIFGVQQFDQTSTKPWSMVRAWEKEEAMYVLHAEGNHLIKECAANPDSYIRFPVIFNSIQEVWVDGLLTATKGNFPKRIIDGQYTTPSLSCNQILGGQTLTWKVYSSSFYFARVNFFPHLSSSMPTQGTLSNTIQVIGAAILIFLSIFGYIVFSDKLPNKYMISFQGTCIFLALYCICCAPASWGLSLTIMSTQKVINGALTVGAIFMIYLLNIQGFVSKYIFWATIPTSTLPLALLIFGSSPDLTQSGLNINFVLYFLCISNALISSFGRMIRTVSKHDMSTFVAIALFVVACSNDMLVTVGAIDSIMIFPVGLISLLIYQGIYLHHEVGKVYIQRDDFQKRLEGSYQEKLKLIQDNIVAHTIANTTQMIAHDILKPFALLKGILYQLSTKALPADTISRFVSHIETICTDVDNMLSNLLITGKDRINKLEPVSIEDVADYAWSSLTVSKQPWRFHLHKDFQHRGSLFVDKAKTRRLILNLLSNAIEAMPPDAIHLWIKSSIATTSNRVLAEITVGNEGTYIPPEELHHLFTKFYTKGKSEGTGLGLAICYEIVKSHGGEIYCRSNKESGTEFIFTLPVVETASGPGTTTLG